ATWREASEVRAMRPAPGSLFSTCRTCEIGVGRAVGTPYRSLVHLVREEMLGGCRVPGLGGRAAPGRGVPRADRALRGGERVPARAGRRGPGARRAARTARAGTRLCAGRDVLGGEPGLLGRDVLLRALTRPRVLRPCL